MKNHSANLILAALCSAAMTTTLSASDVATTGATPGQWTMDLDAAKEVAKEKDLPLLLNFTGSDWCGWCKLMDKNVFADKEWAGFAHDKLLLVTIDFPQDKSIVPEPFVARNKKLEAEHGVEGYPTYVLLDSDGKTELARLGAGEEKTAKSFAEEIEGALAFRPAVVEAKVKALGLMQGEKYRKALEAVKKAEKDLEDWIATRPDRTSANETKYEALLEEIAKSKKAAAAF